MMKLGSVVSTAAAAGVDSIRRASDPTPVGVWHRDNAGGPPTLTDDQRRAYESASEQLSKASHIVSAGASQSGDSLAAEGKAAAQAKPQVRDSTTSRTTADVPAEPQDAVTSSSALQAADEDIVQRADVALPGTDAAGPAEPQLPDSAAPTLAADAPAGHQDAAPAGRTQWWAWTAALLGANGTQGALETFVGRLAQEGIRVLSGTPEHPQDVSDSSMAAHAAVNVAMGLVAGARAGLHTYRAMGNQAAYTSGLRGERPAVPSLTLSTAGTPTVPASRLARLSASMAVALTTFAVTSHTGLVAFGHIGSSSDYKVDAYRAVTQSNGNTAYCYGRESVNLGARALRLVSHDALLTPPGVMASSAQYLFNSVGQQAARSFMGLSQGADFDVRWPIISAVAEFVDVDFIAGSARFAEPDRPVELLGGRLAEGTSTGQHPPAALTVSDASDRLTQRAVGRQLVAEMTRVVPYEVGAALRPHVDAAADTAASWVGAVLATATHLREPMWQAEHAVMASARVRRPSSSPPASPTGVVGEDAV
ncbi:hypothetical protein [Burkholderia cepacia]|uniref:hypothetical protein n=1 Tax=Burkholderia cepacia TaxID=292 RepID=UPI000AC28D20|nr:hypothetical protein [Burkholderia cepacia]